MPHALLINGDSCQNASEVCNWFVDCITEFSTHKHKALRISIERNESGMDAVKKMRSATQHKSLGASNIELIVSIATLDCLSIEAQNALLKALEEPARGVIYILASDTMAAVLPTVRSRCVEVKLTRPQLSDFREYVPELDQDELSRAYTASDGNPRLFFDYLANNEDSVQITRDILSKTKYERLVIAAALANNKPLTEVVLRFLQNITRYRLEQALMLGKQDNTASRLQKTLLVCIDTQEAIQQNANPKLHLSKLFIHL